VANETMSKAAKHGDAAGHAHTHGAARYWIVWALLLLATAATVITGHTHPNIVLALAIATFKATLVVLFFMHMSEAAGANRVVFVVSVVFLVLMMLGVFGDLLTRNEMSLPSSVPSTEAPEIQASPAPPGERPPAPPER
jgi:cytochrome c oxidase subunit 4